MLTGLKSTGDKNKSFPVFFFKGNRIHLFLLELAAILRSPLRIIPGGVWFGGENSEESFSHNIFEGSEKYFTLGDGEME